MMNKKMSCGVCENHCEMEVEIDDGEVLDVSGNRCMKGFIYAQQNADDFDDPAQ